MHVVSNKSITKTKGRFFVRECGNTARLEGFIFSIYSFGFIFFKYLNFLYLIFFICLLQATKIPKDIYLSLKYFFKGTVTFKIIIICMLYTFLILFFVKIIIF